MLGGGTTITVYLPKADHNQAEKPHPPVQSVTGTETILVVDDEPAVRRVAVTYLKSLGYRVLEASSGPEAIKVSRELKEPIELLLTDLVMAHMSGREVAYQIAPARPQMRVIYMSGHSEAVIAHHGLLSDSETFLSKPFRLEELAGKVRAELDRPEVTA